LTCEKRIVREFGVLNVEEMKEEMVMR